MRSAPSPEKASMSSSAVRRAPFQRLSIRSSLGGTTRLVGCWVPIVSGLRDQTGGYRLYAKRGALVKQESPRGALRRRSGPIPSLQFLAPQVLGLAARPSFLGTHNMVSEGS